MVQFFLSVKARSEADSNRCRRFCRPQPSHSAIRPFPVQGNAKIKLTFDISNKMKSKNKKSTNDKSKLLLLSYISSRGNWFYFLV